MKDTIAAAVKKFIEAAQAKNTGAFLELFNEILKAILDYVSAEV